MRIRCGSCGHIVSTEIPDNTVVRGWITCPECIDSDDTEVQLHALRADVMTIEAACRDQGIDGFANELRRILDKAKGERK